MEWEKEGVNYWDNEDCPIEYLKLSLIELIEFVEGVGLPPDHFDSESRGAICKDIEFYEGVADK